MIAHWKRRVTLLTCEHQDFVMLLILFAAFRLMTVLFFQPGGYFRAYSISLSTWAQPASPMRATIRSLTSG